MIECLRRVQDLIFYSVFLFLGSLWIIPYKAKSEISDILSSLPNNLVIIILLFSSLIMCGVGAGVGVQYASTEILVIRDTAILLRLRGILIFSCVYNRGYFINMKLSVNTYSINQDNNVCWFVFVANNILLPCWLVVIT